MENQPTPVYGYQGEPSVPPVTYQPPTMTAPYQVYAQKITPVSGGLAASPGQRLALAIVSLSLLLFLIFGLTAFAAADHAPNWAVIPIMFVICLFSVVATVINVVFNRHS